MDGTSRPTKLRATPVAYLGEGHVEADNLTTDNSAFMEQLAGLTTDLERGALCQAAFEVGVLIWAQAKHSNVLPDLKAEVDRLEEAVARATEAAVTHVQSEVHRISSPEGGVLASAVTREVDKLRLAIDAAFDEDDRTSAVARIEVTVAEAAERIASTNRAEIQRLLDASSPDSPLERLRRAIATDVNSPLQSFSQTLRDVEAYLKSIDTGVVDATGEGREFEEIVGSALARIAQATGDEFEATGETTGAVARSKVGDFVITLSSGGPARPRVVFEAKRSSLSSPKAQEELERAAANREAEIAVLVFAEESQSPARSPLVRLAPCRYAAVLPADGSSDLALQVAYQLACADARAIVNSSENDGLDVDLIAAKTKEAQELLNKVSQVKGGLTSAQSGIDSARQALEEMRSRIADTLAEISSLVHGGSGSSQ